MLMPNRESKKEERRKKREAFFNDAEIWWDKLDNTAHIFPVIAGENMSNVYRISVILKEDIIPEKLQEALSMVLPKFKGFNVRLRQGLFWYYFEKNGKPAPTVREESYYPCRLIVPHKNRSYLFRVSYYKKKINLEVFHVLSDGMGSLAFLKELTYQYLRLVHPTLRDNHGDTLSSETSMNREDSFLSNFKKKAAKPYVSNRAFLIKGPRLTKNEVGILHGYMQVEQLKTLSRSLGVTINELLVAVFTYSIYQEHLEEVKNNKAIRIAVPVNLRGFFDSITTKNFFAVVSSEFHAARDNYTFEAVLEIVKASLRNQITPDNLMKIVSYNVSNEKNLLIQVLPLEIKKLAMYYIFRKASLANTSTISNLGNVVFKEEYAPYIDKCNAIIALSKGQNLKGIVCSYNGVLSYTFSSILVKPAIQRRFFRKFVELGVDVAVESNGVYDE
ncbi:MAG: hypothetical protein BGO41_10220 [Clostridiales bacterium 38-18]|nr:MAG: hypothetical protein BGO41_10220 [Clostridiales bacterium 38-18]